MAGVSYRGSCPYCQTEHVEFRAAHAWGNIQSERRALFKCGFCGEAVIRGYEFQDGKRTTDITQSAGNIAVYGVTVNQQWPVARSTDAPPDCPANVASYFKQAGNALTSGSFDASGMMFRKTLEAATKSLDPSPKAKNLASRIQSLVGAHLLTPALGDWANEVRLGGNDAAHDEDPFTMEEADALHSFTENFLNYAFTMPAAVARRSSPAQS